MLSVKWKTVSNVKEERKMKKIYLILLMLTASFTISAQEEAVVTIKETPTKTQADSAYINNDFAGAIAIYEAILTNEGESANIYYNLGNSYYKMDNIAKAVLNYEKALLLNPSDRDIRFNLELAQSKTIDKVIPMSEMFFVTWTKSLTNTLSEKGWSQVGIFTFILTLLALALYFFGKKIILKKTGFISAIVFFLVCIIANSFASVQKKKIMNHNNAIIMTPSITVKSTPNEGGTDLFILHEGRKVMIKDNTMKEWKEIQLEDGNVGWVPTNAIELI